MKWYLLALVVVPAFFLLADLAMRPVDAWRARHRVASYVVFAVLGAVMLGASVMGGVHSLGEWLFVVGSGFYVVYFTVKALRARRETHAEQDAAP